MAAKVSRKEIGEIAAATLQSLKKFRPDLTKKQVRAVCSNIYHQLLKEEHAH